MDSNEDLARTLYETYAATAKWKAYDNTDLKQWLDVRDDIKTKWGAVANKVEEIIKFKTAE